MSRLIDADALLERMKRTNRYFNVKFDIDEAPTVDAEPVVHGRWVSIANKPHMIYECSLCKNQWGYGSVLHMRYCSNCGAKMDLEVDGDDK